MTATTAASAVTQATAGQPGAILVDVGLPDRDGVDLARELAGLPWSPHVVLTSTDRDASISTEGPETGHTPPFLPKDELADGALRALLIDR
jgi:DNA-binding response OmpR family regulator